MLEEIAGGIHKLLPKLVYGSKRQENFLTFDDTPRDTRLVPPVYNIIYNEEITIFSQTLVFLRTSGKI